MSSLSTLVLGGARSGKSAWAEERAAALAEGGPVTYLATSSASDRSMNERIAAHRARRPNHWSTVEVGHDLAAALQAADGVALVDSLGTWVAEHVDFAVDAAGLIDVVAQRGAPTILVSDEVGLGVHPPTEIGMVFRDRLGELNRAVADTASEVVLVVAGRALRLP